MNDDAKYFFFLSGFIGFIFFYGFSLVLNHDPLKSLIYGAIGSLFFSLSWRMLLSSALKKVQCTRESVIGNGLDDSEILKKVSTQSPDGSASSSDLVSSTARANMEASSTRKSLTSAGNSLKK
ncbi:MAG: hypothetical protein O3B07_02465 [Verrucomicrobia bacterium]|jgi:hypothetical protein|nr:hypothetical protein [Verrucomicrobiota bacterium]